MGERQAELRLRRYRVVDPASVAGHALARPNLRQFAREVPVAPDDFQLPVGQTMVMTALFEVDDDVEPCHRR